MELKMKNWWLIFVEDVSGEIIEAFTWIHDKESGINRAKKDAVKFGYTLNRVWAEPVPAGR